MAAGTVQAGFLSYDLEPFTADCIARVAVECEREGITVKAYPVFSRVAPIGVDFPYRPSRVRGRFFSVNKPGATPDRFTSTINWGAAWACAQQSDVIVLLGIQAGTALAATFFARLLRRPVVSANLTAPPEWERNRVWWVRWLKGAILKRCRVHILQTPVARDTLTQVYGISEASMVAAPFESGARFFQPLIAAVQHDRESLRRAFGWGDETVFLFVGTLLQLKGIRTLISATQTLAQTNSGFKVVCIGAEGGPHEPRIPDYQRAAREANVEALIEFHGGVAPEQLARAYVAADAFVLPTHKDTWGKVLVEAALAGLPLITTTACGAAGTLVQDGQSGFVVAPKDSQTLADAMRRLLDPDTRREVGSKARATALAFCDPEAEVAGFREAILKACA
jgi:glycosyltransferase involved in cell wall biosynthesis